MAARPCGFQKVRRAPVLNHAPISQTTGCALYDGGSWLASAEPFYTPIVFHRSTTVHRSLSNNISWGGISTTFCVHLRLPARRKRKFSPRGTDYRDRYDRYIQ